MSDAAGGNRPLRALGLMSGTSLDGIDAALIETDGKWITGFGPSASYPYSPSFRQRLRGLLGHKPTAADAEVIAELTDLHFDAVVRLCEESSLDRRALDLVGFHGQTVLHEPAGRLTCQIGDGQRLADRLGVAVVYDFRSADVRAGGEGAPLVPLYHAALARDLAKPLAVLNIGGVANITWIGSGFPADSAVLAFDTGPGNALLDDWMLTKTGHAVDAEGAAAAAGEADQRLVARWLEHPYFRRPPPKSLDRDSFRFVLDDLAGVATADGAATLTRFTARAVAAARRWLPEPPRQWLVCGGGRHNRTLMRLLADELAVPVVPVETVGWRGDCLEAEAFAFLAARALRGLPLTLPTTTGAPRPLPGGTVSRPRGRSSP